MGIRPTGALNIGWSLSRDGLESARREGARRLNGSSYKVRDLRTIDRTVELDRVDLAPTSRSYNSDPADWSRRFTARA